MPVVAKSYAACGQIAAAICPEPTPIVPGVERERGLQMSVRLDRLGGNRGELKWGEGKTSLTLRAKNTVGRVGIWYNSRLKALFGYARVGR